METHISNAETDLQAESARRAAAAEYELPLYRVLVVCCVLSLMMWGMIIFGAEHLLRRAESSSLAATLMSKVSR